MPGTAAGTGTLSGAVNVLSGGTLMPGQPLGTLNVAGTVTFNAGSIYAVHITPSANSATSITGAPATAVINGGTTALFMLIIGMPYWLVLGIWTGVVAQFVPTIGTYIAIILPTVVGLLGPNPIQGVLVLGWGSTYGPIAAAVRRVRAKGLQVAQAHLRHLNPFPANTGEVLRSYDRVLVPEMNLGQLRMLVRAEFLVDAIGYNQVRGMPFKAAELAGVLEDVINQ